MPIDKPLPSIQKMLDELSKHNRRAMRVVIGLLKLAGHPDPPTVKELLTRRVFQVGPGDAKSEYHGRLADGQYDALLKWVGNADDFSKGVAHLIMVLGCAVVESIRKFQEAFDYPPPPGAAQKAVRVTGAIPPPPTGCCQYDATQKDDVAKSFCDSVQGTFFANQQCKHVPSP